MSKQNKQERHYRNRIKELNEKTKQGFKSLSEKAQEKVTHTITNALVKKAGVTTDNSPDNVKRYCIFVGGLISAARHDPTGNAMNKIRVNILNNLPKDVADFVKHGKTKDEIINFYWDCKEFQELFNKLGFNKQTLESMVDSIILGCY